MLSAIDSVPSAEATGLRDFPAFRSEGKHGARHTYIEVTRSGDPSIGWNLNEESYELWSSIEEEIDEIKRRKCNKNSS